MNDYYLIKRRFGHLGDILMMTPALKEFSKKNKFDMQLPKEYTEILINLDFIENVYTFEDKVDEKKYSDIIDLSDFEFNYEQIKQPYIDKTKQEIFANALNVIIKDLKPIINLTNEEIIKIRKFLPDKKVILFALRSRNISRDWDLDNWKRLIELLEDKDNYQIIIVDEILNWDSNKLIFFNNKTTRELFALVHESDLVITQDSGLLHIAGAFDKKTIALFGPTDYNLRSYKKCHIFYKDVGCSPCWYNRCDNKYCLNLIGPSEVFEKISELIK
jgi:ADP-heptose:LPS heptosyltransferase